MAQKMQRGLSSRNEIDPTLLMRDTRTLGMRISAFYDNRIYVAILLFIVIVTSVMVPGLADILFVFSIISFWVAVSRSQTLPFRMPMRAHELDYNDLKPGSGKPNMARGITFFGNEKETNQEIWFNNEDMRTHVLIFGSTGSGKTETLISIAYSSLLQGSGFIYVDGKGDNTLYSKIFSMSRYMGREDDVLVINFMTGARDIVGPQEKRLSNTINPFSTGSSSMLAQLVVSMMDQSAGTPDGDMWKGRAISFVEALMRLLVWARDAELILLDANSIRNYFILDRIEAMVMDKTLIRDDQEPASLEDAPENVMEPIRNYLYNLPGYDKAKKGKQVSQVLEQHGFITMQLTRVFTSLADTYGHIMRTKLAEVDVKDVVLNRRIMCVLLPALEKSPDELSNLGKIIVSSLKAMMASGLGEEVEGSYRDVIMRKPTNSPTPFVCILDEYGYYSVQGFAVVPAQARSLGFSAIFAGQDLPAFQRTSKEEAASIGANTNIKICMKLEDPTETWDFFMKTAGEAYVTKVDHFQTQSQSFTNSYLDTRSASFEKRARVDLLDLKDQGQGEMHIFFQSKLIRARSFYANPKPVKHMRLNQFLKVASPKNRVLIDLDQRLNTFKEALTKDEFFTNVQVEPSEIEKVQQSFAENEDMEPIERGVNALLSFHTVTEVPEEVVHQEEALPDYELNVFTKLRYDPGQESSFMTDDFAAFSDSVLHPHPVQQIVATLERLSGKTERHSSTIAEEIIKDMRTATRYPPDIYDRPSPAELTLTVQDAIAKIQSERERRSKD